MNEEIVVQVVRAITEPPPVERVVVTLSPKLAQALSACAYGISGPLSGALQVTRYSKRWAGDAVELRDCLREIGHAIQDELDKK